MTKAKNTATAVATMADATKAPKPAKPERWKVTVKKRVELGSLSFMPGTDYTVSAKVKAKLGDALASASRVG